MNYPKERETESEIRTKPKRRGAFLRGLNGKQTSAYKKLHLSNHLEGPGSQYSNR